MSYLVSSTAAVQSVNAAQNSTQSHRFNLSALDVDYYNTFAVRLSANTQHELLLSGINRVHVISIRSNDAIVDYALGDVTTTVPAYTTYGSNFTLRIFNGGVVANRLFLRSLVNTDVEVVVAGRLS